MAYEDYVEEITIEGVEDLFDYITGRKNIPDLREDFIFRGVKSSKHELIPSSLRKDYSLRKDNNGETIDGYFPSGLVCNHDSNPDYNNYERFISFIVQDKKVLFEFLDRADKQGFKIPIPLKFRENFNNQVLKVDSNTDLVWPEYDYFDAISLAQHYGIPTCALDWSRNYKVALYFATIGILEEKYKNKDCVLWAFNYKFANSGGISNYTNSMGEEVNVNFPVVYRPAYSDNRNLCAQEGLFTFIIQEFGRYSNKPLDQFVYKALDKHSFINEEGLKSFQMSDDSIVVLNDNEKVFYKFIIPQDLKAEILNDLYKEGYTEERIFPGYDSIAKSIENKIKLDKLLDGKKE